MQLWQQEYEEMVQVAWDTLKNVDNYAAEAACQGLEHSRDCEMASPVETKGRRLPLE